MRLRLGLLVVVASTLLALTAQTAFSSSNASIRLKGGPGSVTINGKPAPPGTYLWAGVGPDPQEFPNIEQIRSDGSWFIDFPAGWERVHLYVDGFRVPGGPWDETVPGVTHEIRLDVGADTDPEPIFLTFHAKRSDITLFGQPIEPGAKICSHVDNHWYSCSGLAGEHLTVNFEPGLRDITFSVDSFPVFGERHDALPELAPFWITIHAGDPERPPFEFYGLPGDVDGALQSCELGDEIFIHAIGEDHWERNVVAASDGSWSLTAPSGTTGIRIYASRHRFTHERDIPLGTPTYEATPYGGRQHVALNFRASGWYILPAIDLPVMDDEPASTATHRSVRPRRDLVLGLVVGKLFINSLFSDLDWSWMFSSQGRTNHTTWSDQPRSFGVGPQSLPSLRSNVFLTSCTTRVALSERDRLLATSAFLFGRMGSSPAPQLWLTIEDALVRFLLAKHYLTN